MHIILCGGGFYMERNRKAETGAFVTENCGMGKRHFPKRERSRGGNAKVYASSMTVKIGLCALACAAALTVKLHSDDDDAIVQTQLESESEVSDDKLDEMLGKLRFVEMPGMLEVLAPKQLMTLPIKGNATLCGTDNELVSIVSSDEQYVYARLCGSVKQIGEDGELGSFVRISDGKTEVCCYGLKYISVEEGQPLETTDSIGSAEKGDILYIETRVNGRPVSPCEYFDVDKQV